jgi:hypothetical protein
LTFRTQSTTPTFGNLGFGKTSFGGQHGENNFKGRGVGTIMVITMYLVERMDMKQRHVGSHGRNKRITRTK